MMGLSSPGVGINVGYSLYIRVRILLSLVL